MKRLVILLFLSSPMAFAQGYSTVTCLYGETGTCRQATTCSQANVQAAITASSAGSTGYISPTEFHGDGVYVPAGSCSWSSSVSWSNKNINVIGNGGILPANSTVGNLTSGNTQITHTSSDVFDITVSNNGYTAASFRVAGFTFPSQSTSGDLLNINNSNPNMTAETGFFRIDHITYTYTSSGNVWIWYGPVFGLLDHINGTTPNNHFEQVIFYNFEFPGSTSLLMGETAARTGARFGTQYFDYIEDSTFNCSGTYGSGALSDSEDGIQRMVFRHNTVTGSCYHYAHWTRNGEWDGGYIEIYNNNYTCGNSGCSGGGYPGRFDAGTGVIFNNTITGYSTASFQIDEARGCGAQTGGAAGQCDGSSTLDVNAGDTNAPGWICAGQVGSGCLSGTCTRAQMTSIPFIMWNNGAQAGCSTGGSCTNTITFNVDGPPGGGSCTRTMTNYLKSTAHSSSSLNGAIDYASSASEPSTVGIYTNNYTPYIYPNPLQGGTTSTVKSISGSVTISGSAQ
jgi:hypothetical protein